MKLRLFLTLTLLGTILSCQASDSQQRANDKGSDSAITITIDKDNCWQTIEGWGSSLCWWAHMCGRWEEKKVDELLDLIISEDGLNMNIFRYNIGGGDDPSHADGHMVKGKGKRAEMEGFKAAEDAPYDWNADRGQRNVLLKIKDRRPDAVFEAFSNSAPYWMTISGCAAGHKDAMKDNLKPEYHAMFCDYLIDVCKHYKEKYGVEFKTLEPFNESTSNYWYYEGSQEGCHFDAETQVKLLRVLYPKLKASGLNTVIAASDETNLRSAIKVWKEYSKHPDIMAMVKQFNTHTYSGTNSEREELHRLVSATDMEFWQSESGPQWDDELHPKGRSSFENNLYMAKKLFRDMRIMRPQAWLDWQLIEPGSDTWGLIVSDFAKQEYKITKNYYVRMNVTRFIKQGYTLLATEDENTLAAKSPDGKEIVLVVLNVENKPFELKADISSFGKITPKATLYRTSRGEDCQKLDPLKISGKKIAYTAPAMSISTLIIKTK